MRIPTNPGVWAALFWTASYPGFFVAWKLADVDVYGDSAGRENQYAPNPAQRVIRAPRAKTRRLPID